MPPLIEIRNDTRRPLKVYGRRRGLPETREIHRQLFGTDKNDENQIEQGLAQLSLSPKSKLFPGSEDLQERVSSKSLLHRSPPQRIPQPAPSQTPFRPLTSPAAQPTKCSTLKRNRSIKTYQTSSTVPLTTSEQLQLQSLLSQPNVHSQVVSFPAFASRLLSQFNVSKSGEGSFSECLLLTHKTTPSDVAILKIIPFDLSSSASTPPTSNLPQTSTSTSSHSTISNSTVSAVLREVQILSTLSPHHGFAQLRSCHVVRGPWHSGFLDAYHAFRDAYPSLAENPLPSERWHDDMIYGVIEMDNAGRDLEDLAKPSAFQVFDAFWMSVVLLAVAEKECEFEHRDLHMSNICYRERILGRGYDVEESVMKEMKREPDVLLGLTNLKITIIDYTMSRLRMRGEQNEPRGGVLFNPHSAWSGSSSQDGQSGDRDESKSTIHENHQKLTGQRMLELASLYHHPPSSSPQHPPSSSPQHPQSPNNSKWATHIPQTNVIWLAHLLYQLLQQAGARPRHIPISSAFAKKLQSQIWKQLREVLALIDTEVDEMRVEGTVELLGLGIEKGWLREGDVEGFKKMLNDED